MAPDAAVGIFVELDLITENLHSSQVNQLWSNLEIKQKLYFCRGYFIQASCLRCNVTKLDTVLNDALRLYLWKNKIYVEYTLYHIQFKNYLMEKVCLRWQIFARLYTAEGISLCYCFCVPYVCFHKDQHSKDFIVLSHHYRLVKEVAEKY